MFTHGTSRAVQWLRLCASTARSVGSTLGQGSKVPAAETREESSLIGHMKSPHVPPVVPDFRTGILRLPEIVSLPQFWLRALLNF